MNFLQKAGLVGVGVLLVMGVVLAGVFVLAPSDGPETNNSTAPIVQDGSATTSPSNLLASHAGTRQDLQSFTIQVTEEYENGTTREVVYRKSASREHLAIELTENGETAAAEAFKLARRDAQTSSRMDTRNLRVTADPTVPAHPIRDVLDDRLPSQVNGTVEAGITTYEWAGEGGMNTVRVRDDGLIDEVVIRTNNGIIAVSVDAIGGTSVRKPDWVSDSY